MWLDRFRSSPAQLTPVEPAREYQPRSARFQSRVAVLFVGDDCKHEGECINVSDSGLLARFDKAPELWTMGEVCFEAGEHYLSLHARVARIEGSEVGFAFLVQSDHDRAAVSILTQCALDDPAAGAGSG